jgi:internalin A
MKSIAIRLALSVFLSSIACTCAIAEDAVTDHDAASLLSEIIESDRLRNGDWEKDGNELLEYVSKLALFDQLYPNQLQRHLNHGTLTVQRVVAMAILKNDKSSVSAIRTLVASLRSECPLVCVSAYPVRLDVLALSNCGLDALKVILESPTTGIANEHLVQIIGRLEQSAAIVNELTRRLSAEEATVRYISATSLGRRGSSAKIATQALLRVIADNEIAVRTAATIAISQIIAESMVSDADVEAFAGLEGASAFNGELLLGESDISDKGLGLICDALPNIHAIYVPRRVGNGAVSRLGDLLQLDSLTFCGSDISNECAAGIARCRCLTTLRFRDTPKMDSCEALRTISTIRSLTLLDISGTRFGKDTVDIVSSMSQLKSLSLPSTVAANDVAVICNNSSLKELDVSELVFSDLEFEFIGNMQNITHLYAPIGISDASVPILLKLRGLTRLFIGGTSISQKGIDKLERELVNCEID